MKLIKIATVFTVVACLFAAASMSSAITSYEIEVSYDDEFFIINGEKFQAKTYCFGMEESDKVIFVGVTR